MFSDLNFFALKWSKIALAKNVFFTDFFYLFTSNVQTFLILGILAETLWTEMVSDLKTFAQKGRAKNKKKQKSVNFVLLAEFFCLGASIRIGQEMLCLLYAGFKKTIYI